MIELINKCLKYKRIAICALIVWLVLMVGVGFWFVNNDFRIFPKQSISVAMMTSLSGPQKASGLSMVKAVQLYFDKVNRAGGIDGKQLKLVQFDDAGNAETAKLRAADAVASPVVAGIGHLLSATSVAAGPIYRDGHLPIITASATSDKLTVDNPYFFRNIFDVSNQSETLALYVKNVLGQKTTSIIHSSEEFGLSFTPAFSEAFERIGGVVRHVWIYQDDAASIDRIVSELSADRDPGVLLLAISPNTKAKNMVLALKRKKLNLQMIGASSLGADQFKGLFKDEPEEKKQPGYFTEGIFAVSGLMFDSAHEHAKVFAEDYRRAYGSEPDQRAAKYYETAMVLVEAVKQASEKQSERDVSSLRQRIRSALASFDSPTRSVKGLNGPVYFDHHNTSADVVRMGRFTHDEFISAPEQLVRVENPESIEMNEEIAAGNALQMGERFFRRQHVIYAGIDFNQITAMDFIRHTFTADFFLWFRYTAGTDGLTAVEFPNAISTNFRPDSPQLERTINGLHYRLYRVKGEFRNEFDFHDYPFDRQSLVLRFQHPHFPIQKAVYVIDSLRLNSPASKVAQNSAFSNLHLWRPVSTRYFQQNMVLSSTNGDPSAFETASETRFSVFNAVSVLQRRTEIFLVKSLLPLLLLLAIVFVTLYFPLSLLKERMTIAISSMLAGAVLLGTINARLGDTGYTIAIEYIFYVFFFLCLFCTTLALILERLQVSNKDVIPRVTGVSRLVYAVTVLLTLALYALHYGGLFFL
ncbi:ABC transporter substrate-binding protein [Undibacterium sp.]|uniref:ABC transporter substrate-binding protein n=1 Tax=Undibacterium sp. TaxID=1914977 RepID=UPI0037512DAD